MATFYFHNVHQKIKYDWKEYLEQVILWFKKKQFNSLRQRQTGSHFADNIFNRISLNENVRIELMNYN